MKTVSYFVILLSLCCCGSRQQHDAGKYVESEVSHKSMTNKTLVDTVGVLNNFMEDLRGLLTERNPALIDENIFGDCIYEQLDISEPQPIKREDILRNFNKIFDEKFKEQITRIKKGSLCEVCFYIDNQELRPIGDTPTISIKVVVEKGQFSKIYWFSRNETNWIFRGITGVG